MTVTIAKTHRPAMPSAWNRLATTGWLCVLFLCFGQATVAQTDADEPPFELPLVLTQGPDERDRTPPGLLPSFRDLFGPGMSDRSLFPKLDWLYRGDPLLPDRNLDIPNQRPERDPIRISPPSGLTGDSLSLPEKHRRTPESEALEKSDKLKPSVNLTIELQTDFAWFDQTAQNRATVGDIADGAFFRRARLGVYGELYKTVEYRLEFDFAGDARPRFLDLWLALTELPVVRNVIVGHFFEPFSLERYTPNRFITFHERSLADSFAPSRNMGMMMYGNYLNKRYTWAVGLFRTNSDDYGDHVTDRGGWALTAHNTLLAWFKEPDDYTRYLLHLGASYSYRSDDDDLVRFSSRPSIRMRQQGVGDVPRFVDTGEILDAFGFQLFGAEMAWVHGPVSVQAEWIASQVRRAGDNNNPVFHSGYAYASWFLTGESRSYSPTSILGRFREGIFQRVVPKSNVFDRRDQAVSGIGAWEVAARWSYIDLNSAGIDGGFMEEITVGLNWYLNPYTRLSFNWVRPILRDPSDGRSTANMFSSRFQFEF